MKHIATLTTHGALNYGAVLQAYALHKYIGSLGCKCEVLNYLPAYNEKSYELLSIPKSPREVVLSAFKAVNYSQRKIRKERFDEFKKDHLSLSGDKIKNHSSLIAEANRYDLIVCGSDQIWSPVLHEFDEAYFLSFPEVDVRKVSYAASFGQDVIEDKYKAELKRRLAGFTDFASRENVGKTIIEELTDKQAEMVLDPVFLIDTDEWKKIAKPLNRKKPFNLAYFLSNPGKSPTALKHSSNKSKADVVSIGFLPYDYKYNMIRDYSVGPCEFLDAVASADFILTNSFHCTAFAILFGKNFYTRISNAKDSRNDRMLTLLKDLGLEDRAYVDSDADKLDFEKPIDYDAVNKRLEEKKRQSKAYLERVISSVEEKERFSITDGNCCACGACANICPKQAIVITKDKNGFYQPQISGDLCIRCKKCRTVCPVNNRRTGKNWENGEYFAVWDNDKSQRLAGSSGGAFGMLADAVIAQGGVVFGAAYSDDYKSVYQTSTDSVPLSALKKSKYVESFTGSVFKDVKAALEAGRQVLYCGTSCQIDGLMNFLGKDYGNLLTCDFLCHGVPAAGVYEKYVTNLENKHGRVTAVDFRSKAYGWKAYCLRIKFESGKTYLKTLYQDPYLRLFFENNVLRDSCYECKRLNNSNADVTLGDFWRVGQTQIPDTNEGISLVGTHTEKGKNKISELVNSGICTVHCLEKSNVSYAYNRKMKKPANRNSELRKVTERADLFGAPVSAKTKLKGYYYQGKAVLEKAKNK